MTQTLDPVLAVGQQLVAYCKEGKFREAIEDLYAEDAKHVEADEMGPEMPQVTEGKAALLQASDHWMQTNEVHGHEVKGPYPHRNGSFAVWMWLDVTAKQGPMAHQRMQMEEVCLYQVKDGRITQVEFYWDPTGCED
ncbi:MAG: SnoaL-like domain-containing protein [Planctomycetota bacterium]